MNRNYRNYRNAEARLMLLIGLVGLAMTVALAAVVEHRLHEIFMQVQAAL